MERIRNSSQSASRLTWRIQARAKDAEIDLFDVIGDPWEGVTAKDFVAELRALDADSITLNINSPGGFVDDALAIYDAILRHPADVTARITVAASAASFVAMAADKRVITKNGKFQIHDAHAFIGIMEVANAESIDEIIANLTQAKALLNEESENIANIYAERTGTDAEQWRKAMKANGPHGTVYRGQEAVDAGLADEVAATPARNAHPLRVAAQAAPSPPSPEPDNTDPLAGLDIPPLADHAGYKKPLPNLAGLLAKHPLKVGGK